MSNFQNYSKYYDLLYADKDYEVEANYIVNLLNRWTHETKSILELGCGTGKHAALLAEKGFDVCGIDLSSTMLEEAEERRRQLPQQIRDRLSFTQGDARSFTIDRQYDLVLSLFHVMSYQVTNEDLKQVFNTARTHLKPGGVFIFDCWYGPAVLTEKPEVRVKNLENEEIEVTRIAVPDLHPNENYVDVNYRVFIRDKYTLNVDEIQETHRMRYLFYPEIEELFKGAGMELIFASEWLTGAEPGLKSWSVCFGGKLKKHG